MVAAGALAALFLATQIMAAEGAALGKPGTMETQDDLLLHVAEREPGFGGMFIDSHGMLAVYLLDAAQLPAARSAIEAVFGSTYVPAAGMRFVQGQYTIFQLKTWTERARATLTISGVTWVDLDEAKNRVMIGVERHTRIRAVEQALSSAGIPRQAVLIEVTGPIRPVNP